MRLHYLNEVCHCLCCFSNRVNDAMDCVNWIVWNDLNLYWTQSRCLLFTDHKL